MKKYFVDFLKIDGAYGEGGGQIIRTAVTLSCITKKPIRLENIRNNRKNPGLKAQHLMAIKLLGDICNAKINGLRMDSSLVEFIPHTIQNKILKADVGTAGSISLILQVLIPAISFCNGKLELTITGGTDVLWSPTSEYTKRVLYKAYSRMGIDFFMKIKRRGYYPSGNGVVNIQVLPSTEIKPITLNKRNTKCAELFCSFSKIPKETIHYRVQKIIENLECSEFKIRSSIKNEDARDEGSCILVMSQDSESIVGIDSLFEKKHQRFGFEIDQEFANTKWGVDEHLSDMLVVPASLANGMSSFKISKISSHLKTNLHVASKLTGCKYSIKKIKNDFEVQIIGNSDACI